MNNPLDKIYEQVAASLGVSEDSVYKVITYKSRLVLEKSKEHISIEDSGLGKFKIRPRILSQKLKKLLAKEQSYLKHPPNRLTDKKLESCREEIQAIEKKLDEYQKNIRGSEEQHIPS